MSLSNLRQGTGTIDPNDNSFSAPDSPSNITVNGLVEGTTGTMEFTVDNIDTSRSTAAISSDRSQVDLNTVSGSGFLTYLVDDSIDVKGSPDGTAVLTISVSGSGSGTYTYSKGRVGDPLADRVIEKVY